MAVEKQQLFLLLFAVRETGSERDISEINYAQRKNTQSERYTNPPATIVAATRPLSFQPAKGVFCDLERDWAGSTVHPAEGSKITTSAGAPTAKLPRVRRASLPDMMR